MVGLMSRLDRLSIPAPRGVLAACGAVAIVLGLLVIGSPFRSPGLVVTTLALGAMVAGVLRISPAANRWSSLSGMAWIVCGIAIAIWPGHGLQAIGVLAAIGLMVDGITALVNRFSGSDRRLTGLLLPIATLLAGIATLIWSSVSIVPVCLILGVVLIVRGIAALFGLRQESKAFDPGLLQTIGAVLALVVAFGATGTGAWVNTSVPEPTEFYRAPDDLPAEPGVLLRSEPYEHEQVPDNAHAWRILYTTTSDEDSPAIASGLVIAPDAAAGNPHGVIAWSHGTTGYAEGCAPSILDASLESGAMFVLDDVIEHGWVLVSTDYIGLGTEGPHPYLIGEPTGRAVLDAVRAARQLENLSLSDQTVVWGHSQGGHGALWAGIVSAAGYAPDVPIIGVAALAPAANLTGLVAALDEVTGGNLFASFVLTSYDAVYEDVDLGDYVKPGARVAIEEMSGRCLSERATLVSVLTLPLMPNPAWNRDPLSGPMGQRVTENVPSGPIAVPILYAQGLDDSLIMPSDPAAYVQTRCDQGDTIDYRTYDGLDHLSLVEADSPLIPDLIQWTADRFGGVAPVSSCGG
jgi:uncharacterized membrane protein HdeD (DUF308 family)